MSGHEDAEDPKRRYQAPYTQKHSIPTIGKYQKEKEARRAEAHHESNSDAEGTELGQSRTERAMEGWRGYWHGKEDDKGQDENGEPQPQQDGGTGQVEREADSDEEVKDEEQEAKREAGAAADTSEAIPAQNPKQKRKGLLKNREERAEREVTDPVTHLPVTIYDFTQDSLKNVEENDAPYGTTKRTATGLSNRNKSDEELRDEARELQQGKESFDALFPPPSFDVIRQELIGITKLGITVGLAGSAAIGVLAVGLERIITPGRLAKWTGIKDQSSWMFRFGIWPLLGFASAVGIWYLIAGVRGWMANRIHDTWEDQIWEASLQSRKRAAKAHETESVSWLNALMGSVWPLINPDLFTSLADTLEDVMQASLPSLVQMVSVEDVGQGSESLRILGVRWLPTGAAARSVGADGKIESEKQSEKQQNNRAVPGAGEVDDNAAKDDNQKDDQNGDKNDTNNQDGSEGAQLAEGMEAEDGDFINLEVAFAYRARAAKSFKDRTKDLHLYLAFFLPGGLKLPVWVDVRGIVGTCRMRLQLAPDPPFFALCTITFLGQPKVDISCIPLVKRGLNIMDLPLISNFVQGSVDAAMSEYVAPKSLTLDLKDMLAGDDFKKDTNARGILVVEIKRGYDFEMGDQAIPLISDGSSDPYVSVAWAKFGKPLFSTRVLISEMEPYWNERAYLLVTPQELHVNERVRLQLWDSDRFTADDDLGRIEVDLKEIMKSDDTNGKMHARTDGFRALEAGEKMPGKLEWSVGYFSKTRLQKCQFEKQTFDKDIRSMDQLEEKVQHACDRKLREALIKKGRHSRDADELEQQKQQERKATEDAMIISAPPPDEYPSGIFSIQIHQITGLEVQKPNKKDVGKSGQDDEEEEQGDSSPSAYCNIIVNHKKVFKTRTKPKNSKPFYNAGTERFVADWHNTEVHVSVRDARVDENDPLIGIVHFSLGEVFKERAQINGYYPITGGVGFGRMRISMVWRSVQLQAPKEALGWEYGTLQVSPTISAADVTADIKGLKIKCHSNIGAGKMYPIDGDDGEGWKSRKGRSLYLPVYKRYASCLAIRWKRHGLIKDKTAAFSILWLKDIPDDEEKELTLPVWTGNYERAQANSLEEPGERVGSIKVSLTFWSGIGAAHRRWASKDPNLNNVMEVLDVANDNQEAKKTEQEAGIVDRDGEDTSDSSEDDEDATTDGESVAGDQDGSNGSRIGLMDKAKDYKRHAKQQHRSNRGVMQFKPARTANWASDKAERVESKISGIFKRHTREPGIETEV